MFERRASPDAAAAGSIVGYRHATGGYEHISIKRIAGIHFCEVNPGDNSVFKGEFQTLTLNG